MDEMEQHRQLIRHQEEKSRVEKAEELVRGKVEISAYRNDRNLMLFPFCSTSRRKRMTSIKYTTSDGRRWLNVSANVEYGMAKIWDFDVLKFALSKAGEVARVPGSIFPSFVEFTAYECLKALGRPAKGKASHKWLKEAIQRLSSTTYSGNIFRENEKITSTFTLIRTEYVESRESQVDRIRITFDERLIESARYAKGLLEIDQNSINEESGLKKRLLELVKTSIGGSTNWIVGLERLQALCAHEGSLKEFKRVIKNFSELPWKVSFSPKVSGGDNVTFNI